MVSSGGYGCWCVLSWFGCLSNERRFLGLTEEMEEKKKRKKARRGWEESQIYIDKIGLVRCVIVTYCGGCGYRPCWTLFMRRHQPSRRLIYPSMDLGYSMFHEDLLDYWIFNLFDYIFSILHMTTSRWRVYVVSEATAMCKWTYTLISRGEAEYRSRAFFFC